MDLEERLFRLLDAPEGQPGVLGEAVDIAAELGMDADVRALPVEVVRERFEVFAQRLALEAHYRRHPEARPSDAETAEAGSQLDGRAAP